MRAIEIFLTALLAFWALGSVLFLWRIPRLHPRLARWNRSRVLVHWALFSPSDYTLRPGTFELRYRDRAPEGTVGPWRVGAVGHCWSWRAALWLPERWLATALQNRGREILALMRREVPLKAVAVRRAEFLAQYLERRVPRAPGVVREHQLVRRFASDGTAENVLEFCAPLHGPVV